MPSVCSRDGSSNSSSTANLRPVGGLRHAEDGSRLPLALLDADYRSLPIPVLHKRESSCLSGVTRRRRDLGSWGSHHQPTLRANKFRPPGGRPESRPEGEFGEVQHETGKIPVFSDKDDTLSTSAPAIESAQGDLGLFQNLPLLGIQILAGAVDIKHQH